jgi:anti-sigma regulatory factor (Ser/Thr protein kinase)
VDTSGTVPLPYGAAAPGAGRRLVRERLAGWGLDALVDPVLLLVSEAVTNAVLHTSGPVALGVDRRGSGVLVRVVDASAVLPARRRPSATATTGRGVALLDDLSDEWGAHRLEVGKVVWFLVTRADGAWDGSAERAALSDTGGRS